MTDLSIVPAIKSERDRALELRAAIHQTLAVLLPLMDEVNRAGMRVEFQLGIDSFGRNVVQRCAIIKEIG